MSKTTSYCGSNELQECPCESTDLLVYSSNMSSSALLNTIEKIKKLNNRSLTLEYL